MSTSINDAAIDRLMEIMTALRDPESGCPWDLAQDFHSIAPYTIEEAYEVVEAIERGHLDDLRDELGDLLFHIVFYAHLAQERGLWAFQEVAQSAAAKLIRRHPHVFGGEKVHDTETQTQAWEARKAEERKARAESEGRNPSILDGIGALPGLLKARKLQCRAARVGFDWPRIDPVLDKVCGEIGEIREVLSQDGPTEALEHELGDLLFACVNLARHAGVEPEAALRGANRRFERRFRHVESVLGHRKGGLESASPAEMDQAWEQAKSMEKPPLRDR